MKTCRKIKNDFIDAIDGRLSKRRERKIVRHLETCEKCREEYRALEDTLSQIRLHHDAMSPPLHLDETITREARRFTENRHKQSRFILLRPLPVTAAATLLILVVTGVFLRQYSSVEHAVVGSLESSVQEELQEGGADRPERSGNIGDAQKITAPEKPEKGFQTAPAEPSKPMNIYFYTEPALKRPDAEATGAASRQKESKIAVEKPLEKPVPEPPENIVLNTRKSSTREKAARDDRLLDGAFSAEFDEIQPPGSPEIIRYYLDPGVTAPKIVQQPLPDYPDSLKSLKSEGLVIVRAIIGTDGRISQVTVEQSTHDALTLAVRKTLELWLFEPGLQQGEPVAVPCSLTFRFTGR